MNTPDSKVDGDSIRPKWVLPAPDGPHVGPMDLAIRGIFLSSRDRYDNSQSLFLDYLQGNVSEDTLNLELKKHIPMSSNAAKSQLAEVFCTKRLNNRLKWYVYIADCYMFSYVCYRSNELQSCLYVLILSVLLYICMLSHLRYL